MMRKQRERESSSHISWTTSIQHNSNCQLFRQSAILYKVQVTQETAVLVVEKDLLSWRKCVACSLLIATSLVVLNCHSVEGGGWRGRGHMLTVYTNLLFNTTVCRNFPAIAILGKPSERGHFELPFLTANSVKL